MDCILTAEDIVKLLSRADLCCRRPSFFDPLRRYPIPRGTPSAGAQNTQSGENWQFSTEITVYLKNGATKAHFFYETLIGSHMWQLVRSVSVTMTLSARECHFKIQPTLNILKNRLDKFWSEQELV